jgi:hypothetical protein
MVDAKDPFQRPTSLTWIFFYGGNMEKARVTKVSMCKKDSECEHGKLVEVRHYKKGGISKHFFESFCNYQDECPHKITGILYIET